MSALLEENPAYQVVTVLRLEYSQYRGDPIVDKYGVTSRATLVMLKGDKEIGRVQWSASKDKIEPLFKAVI